MVAEFAFLNCNPNTTTQATIRLLETCRDASECVVTITAATATLNPTPYTLGQVGACAQNQTAKSLHLEELRTPTGILVLGADV